MDNFKTYYQVNEATYYQVNEIFDKAKKAVAAVASAPGKVADAAVGAMGDLAVPDIANINTFEDLNRIIKGLITKARVGEVADQAVSFAVDQVLGVFPFASNIKSGIDLLRGATKQPDGEDTGSFIDKLDVDDELSKIVDDPIEGNFLKHIQKVIEKKKGPIPPDWDMNMQLKQYLSDEFEGRTVAGSEEDKPVADPHLKSIKA